MLTRSLCHALPTADEDADEDVWQGAQLSSVVGACDGTTEARLSNIQHDRAIPKLAQCGWGQVGPTRQVGEWYAL